MDRWCLLRACAPVRDVTQRRKAVVRGQLFAARTPVPDLHPTLDNNPLRVISLDSGLRLGQRR